MPRFEALIDLENGFQDYRTREAACLLALVEAGTVVGPHAFDQVIENLAVVAEKHNLSPDDMQIVLGWHEPSLGVDRHV